jgi:hypothetical protein
MKAVELTRAIFNFLQKFGFSKIEAVALFFVLALFVIFACFKFNSILDLAEEEAAKKNLISLRAAVSSYYNDKDGVYPEGADIEKELIDGKYLPKIPRLKIKHHSKTDKIALFKEKQGEDSGTWVYVSTPSQDGKRRAGSFYINCSHKDSNGNVWSSL